MGHLSGRRKRNVIGNVAIARELVGECSACSDPLNSYEQLTLTGRRRPRGDPFLPKSPSCGNQQRISANARRQQGCASGCWTGPAGFTAGVTTSATGHFWFFAGRRVDAARPGPEGRARQPCRHCDGLRRGRPGRDLNTSEAGSGTREGGPSRALRSPMASVMVASQPFGSTAKALAGSRR